MDVAGDEPDGIRSWTVAIVSAAAMIFTFGTTFSYGVFLRPFSDTFAVPVVVLSTVFSVMLFTFFIGSGIVGILVARLRIRSVVVGCGIATGLVAPSLYVVDSYVELAAVFAVVGLSLGTMYVALAAVVPSWFREYQGTATGIIFAGNGLGLFILPPLWQVAISWLGVRQAFLTIMGLTSAVFLVAGAVCRRPGWSEPPRATTGRLVEWILELARSRRFRLLFVGIGLSLGWYMMLATYAIDLFAERGLTETSASLAFGMVGGFSVVSRLGSGFVADRAGFRRTFLTSVGLAASGIALLFGRSLPVLAVAVFLTGTGLGGIATMYIPLLLETYGKENDTAVIGLFNVAIGVVALIVPTAGTTAIAYTGSYRIGVLLTFSMLICALLTVAAGSR